MVQWLKIHLPMQGTWIQSLLREDSTGQLNLCTTLLGLSTTTTKAYMPLSPYSATREALQWEVWALQLRGPSLIATRESLHTATKTQRNKKKKKKNKIFSHEPKEVLMINIYHSTFSSVQFSRSVVSDSSWPHELQHPGLPVHHQLPEFTQTHVHWVDDAIQPSHPLSSPSPSALSLSQHQGLFKWVSSSHQVAEVFEF